MSDLIDRLNKPLRIERTVTGIVDEIDDPLRAEAATALTAKDKEIEALRAENAAINGELNEWVKHAGPYWQARAETAERERDEALAFINKVAPMRWQVRNDHAARAAIEQGE